MTGFCPDSLLSSSQEVRRQSDVAQSSADSVHSKLTCIQVARLLENRSRLDKQSTLSTTTASEKGTIVQPFSRKQTPDLCDLVIPSCRHVHGFSLVSHSGNSNALTFAFLLVQRTKSCRILIVSYQLLPYLVSLFLRTVKGAKSAYQKSS